MAEQTTTPTSGGDPGLTAGIPATPAATPPAPPETLQTQEPTQAESDTSQGDDGQGTAEQVKEKAQGLSSKISDRATTEVDQRTSDLGERVSSVASDLREVGGKLEGQENGQAARVANSAADQAERVAGYLGDADGQQLLRDIEDLGRRQPWLVLAGGVAAGIAAARLLKASSTDRYQRSQSSA